MSLLRMCSYAKVMVFAELPITDIPSWNVLICWMTQTYFQNKALECFT